MVLTRSEKQTAVIKIYNQGKTIRETAQIVHMSFGDISSIRRKESGEAEEQERSRMSKASQALLLFEQAKTPVQVAIRLDIETGEVDRLYKEYWKLKGMHKLNELYAELKENMFSFVKLYQHTKKEGMTPQQIIDALKIAEEIPDLEAERQHIEDCIDDDGPKIFDLKSQKESLANELKSLRKHVEFAREHTDNRLKSMQHEVAYARENTNIELNKQKESLANELDKYKAFLAGELKSLQVDIDKLKQEEQELTGRIQRLKNEEQDIHTTASQPQPQLKQQSIFIALAQAAQEALANDELRKQAVGGFFI